MKKVIICILLVLTVCFFVSSCGKSDSETSDNSSTSYEDVQKQNMNSNFKLTVNGKDISSDKVLSIDHEKQYAEIPLIATLRALDCQVEWVNEKKLKSFVTIPYTS